MKLPKEQMTRELMSWDQWHAFHWGVKHVELCTTSNYSHPPIVIFDTNEMVCTASHPGPELRGDYRLIGVSLWATGDDKLPLLTLPDGTPIKKSWYNDNGQQYFAIDWATRRVVRLDNTKLEEPFPKRLRTRAKAYWPGEGLPPVGGKIRVNRPWAQVVTPEQKDHIQTLIDVQAMEVALTDRKMGGWHHRVGVPTLLSVSSWKDLNGNDQNALFFKAICAYDPLDYLLLHPDEKEPGA